MPLTNLPNRPRRSVLISQYAKGQITEITIGVEVNLRRAIGSQVHSCADVKMAEVRIDAKGGGQCWQSGNDKAPPDLQAAPFRHCCALSSAPAPPCSVLAVRFRKTLVLCDLSSVSSAQMVDL